MKDIKFLNIVKRTNLNSLDYIPSSHQFFLKNEKGQIFLKFSNLGNLYNSKLWSKDLNFFLANKSVIKIFFNSFSQAMRSLNTGFFFELTLRGIGFKCYFLDSKRILLNLGYSHYIIYTLPDNLVVYIKKGKIFLYSISKELLGSVVKDLKNLRIPDAYKAKGIVEPGQLFSLKEGKKR